MGGKERSLLLVFTSLFCCVIMGTSFAHLGLPVGELSLPLTTATRTSSMTVGVTGSGTKWRKSSSLIIGTIGHFGARPDRTTNLHSSRRGSSWSSTLLKKKGTQYAPQPEIIDIDYTVQPGTVSVSLLDTLFADRGLRTFLLRTYQCTGLAITTTLALAQYLSTQWLPSMLGNMRLSPESGLGSMFAIASVMAFASTLGISWGKYTVHSQSTFVRDFNTKQRLNALSPYRSWYSKNSLLRQLCFTILAGSMGVMLSPLLFAARSIAPDIVKTAVVLSSLVFGGSTLFAMTADRDSMLSWRGPLLSGLFALTGFSALAILSTFVPFLRSLVNIAALQSVYTYISLAVFTGLVAYDTQLATRRYEQQDPDHLGAATELYLDFINILVDVLKILMKDRRSKSGRDDDN